ncbi:MAG TPA: hypothetical protein ENJ18_11345, partial [Nannocystis exedens]|nr:hypothetical protein [Nannocystis exedens]
MSTPLHPLLVPLLCVLACATPQPPEHADPREPAPLPTLLQEQAPTDPHSYARPDQVVVRDLLLDLRVRFADHRIAGTVTYRLERLDPAAPLTLDTRDLQIDGVEFAAPPNPGSKPNWIAANFELGRSDRRHGSPLIIGLPGSSDRVR